MPCDRQSDQEHGRSQVAEHVDLSLGQVERGVVVGEVGDHQEKHDHRAPCHPLHELGSVELLVGHEFPLGG